VTVAAVVVVRTSRDVKLAGLPVAGLPWIAQVIARLQHARAVSKVVVACAGRTEAIAGILARPEARQAVGPIEVGAFDDLTAWARDLPGDHDGVAFCEVSQLFADPAQLDALASLPGASAAARLRPVLHCQPTQSLTGGAFVEILTRAGLDAIAADTADTALRTEAWPTWPEPHEIRIAQLGHFDWAASAYEALATLSATADLAMFDAALDDRRLRLFTFWDQLGPAPQSVLTVRCQRPPLFLRLLRHLGRLGAPLDVVCPIGLAQDTASLPGVRRVIPVDAPAFDVAALGPDGIERLRAENYDLCVLPRLEPTGYGFDNLTPLAAASGALTSIWLDVTGRSGLLAGDAQAWDPTMDSAPHRHVDAYLRRGVKALDMFAA